MKNVSLPHTGARLAAVTLFVALTGGLVTATPALAATATPTAAAAQAAPVPVEFVDQTASALPADGKSHEFTVTYANTTASDLIVAPQLLLVSPDSGPFLKPADVKLELRKPDGCWTAVTPGNQTGTLFTDLTTAQRSLAPGETLTQVYRVTVNSPGAVGTVQPRVVLYA
ncbi:signal peptide protein [Streptomyces sp. NPDC004539]|uniref:signal peptide protein n=1 Tax=Streptomyces sp. NPDC004539 TaxID=3154280 RepID=UPI0033A1FB97